MAFKYLAKLVWDHKIVLIAVAITTFIVGELWFRAPFILQRLEYHPDRLLGAKLRPDQRGFSWLAEMSLKSPPITVNDDGYRGPVVDWSKPTILALGASDTFGSSVSDHDVWSNILEIRLSQSAEFSDYAVINAAHPGFGPSQQMVRLKRFIEKKRPELMIVRVGIGMRFFSAPGNDMQRSQAFKDAQYRENVRSVTKFFPFLYNKLKVQIPRIKQAYKPFFLRPKKKEGREARQDVADKFWEDNKDLWYAIMQMSEAKEIPLLFSIVDLTGNRGNQIIAGYLEKAIREFPHVYLLYLGPETIGVENIDHQFAQKIFRERYTLRLDLHGNALQHQILADRHLEFINAHNLLNWTKEPATTPMISTAIQGSL